MTAETVTTTAVATPNAETNVTVIQAGEANPRALPEGVALLGYQVSWNVQSALVSRALLEATLTEAGFKDALPKRPPTAKRALRRAIAEWAVSRGASGDYAELFESDDRRDTTRRKSLIREIPQRAERGQIAPVMYALVEEISLGEQMGLRYATAYRFRYRPEVGADAASNTGTLTVVSSAYGSVADDERNQVAVELAPLWEKHRDLYNGADISQLLIGIVAASSGVAVESGSGVWYIPARQGDVVDRLERAIRGLTAGNSGHVRVYEQIDWPRTRASLAQAALDDLNAAIRATDGKLSGYADQTASNPGSVKVSTMAGVVKDLIDLRQKALLYADTVGMREERVQQDLLDLGDRARTITILNREARQQRIERETAEVLTAAPTLIVPVAREERD